MPYSRPTLQQLKERIQADFVSRLELQGGILRRTFVGVMSTVFAGVSHILHGFIVWVSKQLFTWSAEGEYLVSEAGTWGLSLKAAGYASGQIGFTGGSGSVVPAGTILTRADGAMFVTQEDGLSEVTVQAAEAGSVGNTDAGAVLNLVTPITGVQSVATVLSGGITNGSDIEDIESLRARILARKQSPPMGGKLDDYVQWMLEVPGVTRAWAFRHWMGIGTVGGTFVRDNDADMFPDAAAVETMQAYVDVKRPAGSEFFAFAPTPRRIDIDIEVYPNTEDVRTSVLEELKAFFLRDAEPGAAIYYSRMTAAIDASTSEYHHKIISPAGDVAIESYEIAVLGGVTFRDRA